MEKTVCFISCHLDLTPQELEQHKSPVIGDLAQKYVEGKSSAVNIYHLFDTPRNTHPTGG
ncbi:hypothetical protein EUZ85_21295 [Hahella sp. KA22]|uniref:hypothetical protein n=1 Tax=Hahella sp. KA22 TaxID=1628392 RepID=UPI000FDE75BE|nr:hypothetical protein [Hahella sp. KA22]AZZ93115.1 hypothetical protein ENC22_18710 [Hahella sp. KA22]QAY56489.1 hypothetical protein EUZ85_21295 [Hahella sp. KA22]